MGLTFFFKIKLRFFGDFFCVSSVGLRNVGKNMPKIPMIIAKSQAPLNSVLLETNQLTKIQKVEGRV